MKTAPYRTRRRAANAFEPSSTSKEDGKDASFFGPTTMPPFFSSAAQRSPEEVQPTLELSRQAEEEEEVQPKLELSRQAEEEEEEVQPKLELSRQAEEEEEEVQPKLELSRQAEEEEEEVQPKLELSRQAEEEEEEVQPKRELSRQAEEEEEEEVQPKLELSRQAEEEEEEVQPKLELSRQAEEEEEVQPKLELSRQAEEEAQAKRHVPIAENSRRAGASTAQYVDNIDGRGRPLAGEDQAWFGQRMGYDFSAVRIHTGADAETSAKASRAKAYTYGNNVVFGPGQFDTDSHSGRHLLAHELTHVVQQGSAKTEGAGAVQGRVGRRVQRGFWGDLWGGVSRGARALWGGVTSLASWSWDVMKSAGAWVWNLITWAPARIWRILKHIGSGIVGIVSWVWSGLFGALGHLWDGLTGIFKWLGSGIEGLFSWIWRGLQGGGAWAWKLIRGDFSGFWDGMAAAWSWLGAGARGLLDWGWSGLEGLVRWSWTGIKGFARWIWDGALGGLAWIGRYLAKVFDLLGVGELWTMLSNIIKFWSTRTLSGVEQAEAQKVFGASIPYWQVRIDEASLIAMIGAWFKSASGMGVTTAQTINFNRTINSAAGNGDMAWLIHELAHVSQYAHVGLQYMGEAIHAQATDGYEYGGGAALAGKDLKDFNREQQADILKHYYLRVLYGSSSYASDYTRMRNQAIQGRF